MTRNCNCPDRGPKRICQALKIDELEETIASERSAYETNFNQVKRSTAQVEAHQRAQVENLESKVT